MAIDHVSDVLYVLDASVIYRIDLVQGWTRVLLGAPATCQISSAGTLGGPLQYARAIAVTADSNLVVLESNFKQINQVGLCDELEEMIEGANCTKRWQFPDDCWSDQ